MTLTKTKKDLEEHLLKLKHCMLCPNMIGPVVTHTAVVSKIFLIGQAPGPHEGVYGYPFAWTAGKTLFRWFESIGVNESEFRSKCYMAAVCRCFPGKSKQGGDRVPDPTEIKACSNWMAREFELLKPELVIPVGRLAIEQIMEPSPLVNIVGKQLRLKLFKIDCDVIPLPHPSGASTWFKKDPGKSLLTEALSLLNDHPAWQRIKPNSR
jgi:uracil-DNA glycosylase